MQGMKVLRVVLTILVMALALVGVRVEGAASASADPVRVMPLGDSITGSPGCWRSVLGNQLQDTGHTSVDFVGTLGPQGCARAYDGDNEGHGGALVTDVANQNQLPVWPAATRPDVGVMHFGTNDVWSGTAPERILAAYSTLVGQMRASNPGMRILAAQIIPVNPSTCPACARRTKELNALIPQGAASESTARSPVVAVDQGTGFGSAADTSDGVHPNDRGDAKIAARWLPALTALLDGGGIPNPTPTIPTPSPTDSSCTASLKAGSVWQGGYQGEVTVRDSGSALTSGWSVRLALAGGARISQLWNGSLAADGSTVDNAGWNGALAAGDGVTFGFIASTTATSGIPSASVSCTTS